jgi:NitT/TauT family transport system permease protein
VPSELPPAYGWRTRAKSLLVGCLIWEGAARLAARPLFPTCSATMTALVELTRNGAIVGNLGTSLSNLVAGFGAAVLVGIGTGIVMARLQHLEAAVEPFLHALLAAPSMIYVPLLFTAFGATRITQIGSVFLHAVFVMTATTAAALRPERPNLVAMASSFGASERQIFWSIRWPAARPLIISGLRVGSLLAVKGMINGEMFIAFTGLGALIRTYGSRFEPDKMLAIVIVIMSVALACSALVGILERRTAVSS